MKLKIISAVALSVIGLASIGSMESSTPFIKAANAQAGSKLCGVYVNAAFDKAGNIVEGTTMLAIEGRPAEGRYNATCNGVRAEMMQTATTDATLSRLSVYVWKDINGWVCEGIGAYLTSSIYPNVDTCDYMNAWGVYMVSRAGAQPTGITTYTKLAQK